MQAKLTIPERLRDLRAERGVDLKDVAAATGLSASALSTYENDERKDISHRAVIALAEYYGVTADYILGLTEIKNHPRAELHELHLDDNTMMLLKSGEINNRLLCEMMAHDGFQRFMMDIVIYVDRIASMQIATLNANLDVTRTEMLMERYPDDKELCLRTLELSNIKEDEYFSHVIHDDLDAIIRDIREAHKTDSTTADVQTVSPIAKFIEDVKAVEQMQGSVQEKQARFLCYQLGIPYDKLTHEEFVVLAHVLQLSPMMRAIGSQRGKVNFQLQHGKGKRKKK